MAVKGSKFNKYPIELKLKAVKLYEEGYASYDTISQELGIRSSTQLKAWVKMYRNNELFDDMRGKSIFSPFRGRPKTRFESIEEENTYLKAQVEYLKKLYPNILGNHRKNERTLSFSYAHSNRISFKSWFLQMEKICFK